MLFFRSEKEEVEMMKAVIPHLRLLTLPMDKLDPFSKYLSNSQKGDLAKFKEDGIPGKVSASLNLSTSPRTRPKTSQLELDFIAEDLIKSDLQMMGSELKENTPGNLLRIKLVPEQHLFLKGIEILTRANNYSQSEFSQNNEESSR